MNQISTRRMILGICITFIVSISLFILVYRESLMESEIEHLEYIDSCRTNLEFNPIDIIEIQNTKFAADYDDNQVRIWKSQDGCEWTEAGFLTFEDPWLFSLKLCKVSNAQLGIVWQETSADKTEESRTTFFFSILDDGVWSEPKVLFHRDQYCAIEDALILEDGGLLILWDEALYISNQVGDRTVKGSGCHIVQRAYFSERVLNIERVMEPENERYCKMKPFAFLKDEEGIWCVFSSGNWSKVSLYRSFSSDGKVWSPPELIEIPDIRVEELFLCPEGICIAGIKTDGFGAASLISIYLYYSEDWEEWRVKKLISFEGLETFLTLTGNRSEIWGIASDSQEKSFIQVSRTLDELPSERNFRAIFLLVLALFLLCLGFLIFLLWIFSEHDSNLPG